MSKRSRAWQALGWFWGVLLFASLAGAAVLQALGPVEPPVVPQATMVPKVAVTRTAPPVQVARLTPPPAPAAAAAAGAPGLIAAPDPALLEPSAEDPDELLPRKSADGRQPMRLYARPFTATDQKPRIALLVSGLGLSLNDSNAAITSLPGPVSFAVSAYAIDADPLLAAMRTAGHEYFLSIPMEPEGFPLNDEGVHSLLTGAVPEKNTQNLDWVLSRIQGYVGATGAADGLRGERYAAIPDMLGSLEDDLAVRGLMYIDPRPGAPSPANVTGRSVDLVVDDPPLRADIEAKLGKLEQMARDRGAALGLAGPPRPVTLERIAAWANGLAARGVTLVPVSALAQPPAGMGIAKAGAVPAPQP
jgi:polysaccharide deacetylase 2 family uncharacterized protein YibQ